MGVWEAGEPSSQASYLCMGWQNEERNMDGENIVSDQVPLSRFNSSENYFLPSLTVVAGSRGLVAQSVTPWTIASQAPLPMRFSRQEYWSRLPFPPAGSLPDPETEPRFPTLEADSLTSEDRRSPINPRLLLLSLL